MKFDFMVKVPTKEIRTNCAKQAVLQYFEVVNDGGKCRGQSHATHRMGGNQPWCYIAGNILSDSPLTFALWSLGGRHIIYCKWHPEVMDTEKCHTEVVELWKSRPSDRELLQRQDDQGGWRVRRWKGQRWKQRGRWLMEGSPFCLGGNGFFDYKNDYI